MIGNKNADIIRAIKNKKCCKDVVLESLSVTENNTYTAKEGKAWNKVTVNVGGEGSSSIYDTFNVNDIILADDLLEKCQALEYTYDADMGYKATTSWTFEDICTQDSCGVLQTAFEKTVDTDETFSSILVENSDTLHASDIGKQFIVLSDVDYQYTIFYFQSSYVVLRETQSM